MKSTQKPLLAAELLSTTARLLLSGCRDLASRNSPLKKANSDDARSVPHVFGSAPWSRKPGSSRHVAQSAPARAHVHPSLDYGSCCKVPRMAMAKGRSTESVEGFLKLHEAKASGRHEHRCRLTARLDVRPTCVMGMTSSSASSSAKTGHSLPSMSIFRMSSHLPWTKVPMLRFVSQCAHVCTSSQVQAAAKPLRLLA